MILITTPTRTSPTSRSSSTEQTIALLHEAGIDQLHLMIHNAFRTHLHAVAGGGPGLGVRPRGGREEEGRVRRVAARGEPGDRADRDRQPAAAPAVGRVAGAPPPAAAPAAPSSPRILESRRRYRRPRPLAISPRPAPPPVLRGVQSRETFAAESSGRLLVAIAAWTAAITAMIALALCAGQHYYLRRGWLPAAPALRGWLGGLLAGLAGGAAGQLLYQAAPGRPAGEAIFRVLGWTLLGSMAGFVLAFFVPNLRSYRGMLGGAAVERPGRWRSSRRPWHSAACRAAMPPAEYWARSCSAWPSA